MEYKIRRAAAEDSDAINRLFNEMLRTIYKNDTDELYEPGYLENNYFNNEKNFICTAEADSEIIGYMAVEHHDDSEEPFLYLDDCSVTAKWRNKGVGTQFFHYVEEYASGCGIRSIYFHVDKNNALAHKLYIRLGYTDDRDDGDRIFMNKRL